jgi:type I restriction enzyme M protein
VARVQLIDARAFWMKMRKSLGEKRREVSAEQIAEITRLHGAFEEGERVKIVPNESLGYRTITVEQPLRARWEVRPEVWEGVEDASAVAKLDGEPREALVAALRAMPAATYESEDEARKALRAAVADVVAKPSASLLGALLDQVIVRDPSMPEQRDKKGEVIADRALRDTENVPLDEDVEAYLDREVRPHVPGAWCPDSEGKVGYEIPFTRLFYTYMPPRPSEEIKAELRELEGQIRQLLEEVLV